MIEVVYAISQSEFAEAQKIWCSRELKKLPGRWLVQIVGVILGGFIGWSFKYLPAWLVVALALSLLAQVAVSMWRKKAIRAQQYLRNAERFQEVEVRIDDSGYRDRKSGDCEGWVAWKSFTGWHESAQVFILGRNLSFITIPKRALNQVQQEEFRTLLRTYLG